MAKEVTVPRGTKRVSGPTALAAFSRKGNGHIIDGEWYSYEDFMEIARMHIDQSSRVSEFVGWEIDRVPRWMRLFLKHPTRTRFVHARPTEAANNVWNALTNGLRHGDEK